MKKLFYIAAAALIVSVSAGFVIKNNQQETVGIQSTPTTSVSSSSSQVGQIESNPARWD